MNTTVLIILVLVAVGLLFGFILAFAYKKWEVPVNPLVHLVEDVLPKGQCGACGFAGCAAYADAVVNNPDVAPNMCVPGKQAVADQVAKLTGKEAAAVEPQIAYVRCQGGHNIVNKKYGYHGVQDCHAAVLLYGGDKACQYGCLGFGTCTQACKFGALTIGEDGLPKVNALKCTGCGACMAACPKQVIAMVPLKAKVSVTCCSKDKGAPVKKLCQFGCISCTLCMRQCPHGAIVMENNLPKVDYSICATCEDAKCLEKCPTKAIRQFVSPQAAGTLEEFVQPENCC